MAERRREDEAGPPSGVLDLPHDYLSVARARHALRRRLTADGFADLVDDAELVVSELVGNAVLHGEGGVRVAFRPLDGGVRVEVSDGSRRAPALLGPSDTNMTGRGMLLVQSLASRVGFEPTPEGKVVWAELVRGAEPAVAPGALADAWSREWPEDESGPIRFRVELGDVPTDLLLAAKAHVDNLVREFLLAAAGAESGATAAVPEHLAELIEAVVHRFSDARLSIKHQALDAARHGRSHVRLELHLPAEAADAGEEYLRALDEADSYCRAARLLTLETPPQHRVFRRWYVEELVTQLRQRAAGAVPRPPQTFEERLLKEIDTVAAAQRTMARAARLYAVASSLAGALSPQAVAEAVLTEGVAALGASGGGLLLPGPDRLDVPGTVGYDPALVESLRAESPAAELPAAWALRTGRAVWLESRAERDSRFPGLVGLERRTVSLCAVPLEIAGRLLGALRFSFSEPRLFDEDERRFVLALATQAAQALDRARLYQARTDLSHRLQRSLLPPRLPDIAGVDLAAVYHPLGDGLEAGGDFYDVWQLAEGEWAFAIGDVCGTGPEAAGLTALVRYSLRAVTGPDPDRAAVLRRLNQVLLEADPLEDGERFCTVLFGTVVARPGGGTLRLATGGHPGPMIRRADGTLEPWDLAGSLLGVLAAPDVMEAEVHLAAGDVAVLFTDGVTEARGADGGFFDMEGLATALGAADHDATGVGARLEESVLRHSGGELHDDMALLVFAVAPRP